MQFQVVLVVVDYGSYRTTFFQHRIMDYGLLCSLCLYASEIASDLSDLII